MGLLKLLLLLTPRPRTGDQGCQGKRFVGGGGGLVAICWTRVMATLNLVPQQWHLWQRRLCSFSRLTRIWCYKSWSAQHQRRIEDDVIGRDVMSWQPWGERLLRLSPFIPLTLQELLSVSESEGPIWKKVDGDAESKTTANLHLRTLLPSPGTKSRFRRGFSSSAKTNFVVETAKKIESHSYTRDCHSRSSLKNSIVSLYVTKQVTLIWGHQV